MQKEQLKELKLQKLRLLKEKRKIRARNNLDEFVLYTFDGYDMQWFHQRVCEYLDKLLTGEIKKLMIFMPPQHSKSELSSRRFPAYALGKNPDLKIAVASYSQDLSSGFSRDCQSIIMSDAYKELFPNTKLNENGVEGVTNEVKRDAHFEIVGKRGSYTAVGIGTPFTGKPVDIGVIDDPFKDDKDADSETMRQHKWNWYQNVFLTRMHNDSRQLMLFTRWHEDDLAGRILDPKNKYYNEDEAKEWTVIALPALKEEHPPVKQAIDIDDPREIGEALWEERHSAKKYQRRKIINPRGFNALDQQRPSAAEGNKMKREWFQIINKSELPFNPSMVSADFWIDGAFTDQTKNDETGLLSCYYNKADNNLYIFNCQGVRYELYELLKFFIPYVKQSNYGVQSNVFIELKASGHPLKSMLRKVEYGGFNTRDINSKTVSLGKMNRAENASPILASMRIFLVKGGWNESFIDQCTSFPNGLHDDMVDVLCYAIDHYYLREEAVGVSYN